MFRPRKIPVAGITDDHSITTDHNRLCRTIAEHLGALTGTALGIRWPGLPICKNRRLEELVTKLEEMAYPLETRAAE